MGQYDYTGTTGAANYSGESNEYRNGSSSDRMGASYQSGYRGENRTNTNRWSQDEGDEITGSGQGGSTRRGSYGSGSSDSDSRMTGNRYGSGSDGYGSSSSYDAKDYAAGGRYGTTGNRYSSGGYGTSNYGTSSYGGSRSSQAPYGRSYGSGQSYGSTGSYGTDEDYTTGTSYGRGSRYGSSTNTSRNDDGYGSTSSSGSYSGRSERDYDDDNEEMSFGSDDYRDGLAIDETRTLISSSKVEGTAVYDRDGSRMGTIHNFMVNKRSGRVDYAVLSFGGFLGMGTRYYPLPWDMLEYDTSMGGYAVDMDEDDLEEAPSFRSGEEPDFSDRYGEYVYGYYGMRY